MKKVIVLFLLLIAGVSCKNASSSGQIVPQKEITNAIYYAQKPIISAHRAGKGIKGYPENCLQTIQHPSLKVPMATSSSCMMTSLDVPPPEVVSYRR